MDGDTFDTLAKPSQGYYQEKGSKFLAFAYPINALGNVEEIISRLKQEYPDARHHCYAYILQTGPEAEPVIKANDDGEPNHSAGDPILGQIKSHQLNNVLIAVIRYFGGTKLGISGLINAYKTAAKEAITNNSIVTAQFTENLIIKFPYEATNQVNQLINNFNITVMEALYEEKCTFTLEVPCHNKKQIMEKFTQMKSVACLED